MPDALEYIVEVEVTSVFEYRYKAIAPLIPDDEKLDTMVAGAARAGRLMEHLEGEPVEIGPTHTRISEVRREGKRIYPRRDRGKQTKEKSDG